MRFVDITGQRFGRLVVESFSHKEKSPGGFEKYFWKCKCDCGNTKIVGKGHLTTNKIRSCGCLSRRKGNECPSFCGYKEISGKLLYIIKKGAEDRDFEYALSNEYLWELFLKQNRKCALTGLEIGFETTSRSNDRTASLDRIDSVKGYIKGNVQWVHKDVNMMKQNYTQNRFLEICNLVACQNRQS
jgi:hypothetical protein